MAKPDIMQKAEDALDFIGIGYGWDGDMIVVASNSIQIWTENGRQLRCQPYATIHFIEAIIRKMEVQNGK